MADSNFLLFRSAGRTLALPSELTRQVLPIERVYPLPGSAGALLGLIPLAGRSVPLVDLTALSRLGQGHGSAPASAQHPAPAQRTPEELALVCEIAGEQLALPVEEVLGFVRDDSVPNTNQLLSEEMTLGGYFSDARRGQLLSPHILLQLLHAQILPS